VHRRGDAALDGALDDLADAVVRARLGRLAHRLLELRRLADASEEHLLPHPLQLACAVKSAYFEIGAFGAAWLQGHGLSVRSAVMGRSSRVRRAASSLRKSSLRS